MSMKDSHYEAMKQFGFTDQQIAEDWVEIEMEFGEFLGKKKESPDPTEKDVSEMIESMMKLKR